MWYDSFLFQLQGFANMFRGQSFYWGDIFNGTTVAILLTAIFTLAFAIAAIVNGTASGEVKLARSFRRIRKYAQKFGVISKSNFIHFNKACIGQLPQKVKKAIAKFIFNPSGDTQLALQNSLNKCAARSCTAAFIAYIVLFGIGAVVAVVAIALESFYLKGNTLWLAISLFYGAILLVTLALQMYYISNKYKSVDTLVYTEIACRVPREETLARKQQHQEAVKKTPDSIDELRRVVYGLIEGGASKELLSLFKDGLSGVAATKYNSTADQLRLENIITRIDRYMA